MAIRITCITPDAEDPDTRIAGVGGLHGWTECEDTAIGEIEDGANYYVEVGVERIPVVVAERDGRKYLRTDPDKTTENDLLSLPHCPSRLSGRAMPSREEDLTALPQHPY